MSKSSSLPCAFCKFRLFSLSKITCNLSRYSKVTFYIIGFCRNVGVVGFGRRGLTMDSLFVDVVVWYNCLKRVGQVKFISVCV